jgi:nucleotide-binding universal stress UspA family protein
MKLVDYGGEEMIQKILVPTDFSEAADHALDYALNVADKYGASVEILNVVERALVPIVTSYPTAPYPSAYYTAAATGVAVPVWAGTYSKELRATSVKMLSQALKKAKGLDYTVTVSTSMMDGKPANKIVERAKDGNFDLIVMGSRGLGALDELILGSVSNKVADNAECPVMIVK